MQKFSVLLILVSVLLISCETGNQKTVPPVKQGVLNLYNWDFDKDSPVKLNGEWEFYWQQFLSLKEFDTACNKSYIIVPHEWNKAKLNVKGYDILPADGYATYRLRIIINKKLINKQFALKMPDQGTAFKLFLGDSLIGENGITGKTKETSNPQYKQLFISIIPQKDTVELICWISNFHYYVGGMYFTPEFGEYKSLNSIVQNRRLVDYGLLITLLIFFLIISIFFILRPREKASLYGGLIILMTFVRTSTVSEKVILEHFPNINWEFLIKLEDLSWFFALFLFTVFYWVMFRKEFPKYILYIMSFCVLSMSTVFIICPARISSNLIFYGQMQFFLAAVLYIIIAIKAIKNKREGPIIILIGSFICTLSGINEVLYYNSLMNLYFPFNAGMTFFCFSQISLISLRFAKAFDKVENFAKELKKEVDAKTKDLQYEKEKSDNLLLNVLPEQIATRLKDGETTIADHFDEASIVFIDIADFTKMSEQSSPQIMVKELNRIFTVFDKISQKYGLEKIKTIGDCYMAAAGIPEPRQDHAEAVASMAMEVLEVMKGYKTEEGFDIRFRIGLDCGPIVAGVIGEQKFIYDLWGDPVNTASRMEYFGVIGKIQCTARFKEKLERSRQLSVVSRQEEIKNKFDFTERGEIEVKGKGVMRTWFLEAKKASIMEEA